MSNQVNYEDLGAEVGRLVSRKQEAYGDSFGRSGDVLRVLYPNGINAEQLDDALVIVRILDKLFRIATNKDAMGESPYKDIAGYALLGMGRDQAKRREADADYASWWTRSWDANGSPL